MKLRGRPGRLAAPAVATALLLLSGCGQLTPGTAAVVNGTKISNSEVNDLADAQCAAADRAAKSGQSQTMAMSRVKQQSLGLLMDTELSLQFAEDKGITPEKSLVNGFYGQLEQGIAGLPEQTRAELQDVFHRWAEGRAVLVQAGSKATGQQPSGSNLQQLLNAGLQARDGWLKNADISTDPRYAPSKEGYPGGGDSSVSKAGSDFAKGAGGQQPDPTWVSGLPASQKCG